MDAAESTRRTAPLRAVGEGSRRTGAVAAELSERDHEILAFERQWWKHAGSKEKAVRELFCMSSTRYYQVLNRLIDSQAALREDPMLIRRLRKARAGRRRVRVSRKLGIELR